MRFAIWLRLIEAILPSVVANAHRRSTTFILAPQRGNSDRLG